MEQLKIIQHNVLKWTPRRSNELNNIYKDYDPDIILLNSIGVLRNNELKIYPYNVYHRNITKEDNAGVAIAIKKTFKHKLLDTFNNDILGVELDTNRGKIIVATMYIPPRFPDFNLQNILNLARKPSPVYIFADLNARHMSLGHKSTNARGRILVNLIRKELITFFGPDFKTYINDRGSGTPDIVIGNRHANLNLSITQGPLTTSDHLPVYVKLATKPIISRGKKMMHIKKANWEAFQTTLNKNSNSEEETIITKNKAQIDKELGNWFEEIDKAIKHTIPATEFRIMPHPRVSDKQKITPFQIQSAGRTRQNSRLDS